MQTCLRNKGIVVLLLISILSLLPTPLQCQNACLGPETEGFGTRETWIAVDISRLTPNTAVDPDPTIRPKQVGCHPESTDIDGRTITWMADCREMTTRDQRPAGKMTPDDFYSSRAGVPCQNYLRAGVSFYRLPFLIFGRDEVDSQGTVRFMRYAFRETWVWYKADTNSFYLLPSHMNGLDLLYGPFKGDPLIELRKAIRPYREQPLPGVTASAVSHHFFAGKKPPETPPPSREPETRNYSPEMAWRKQWSFWNSSQTTIRLSNNTGGVLYYLTDSSELVVAEKQTEGGIYAYGPWGFLHKLEPGQSVERLIFNRGVSLPLSECARQREFAQSLAAKSPRTAGSPVASGGILSECPTAAPTRHIIVFVTADPVLYDQTPIEITYTPPLRETLPSDAPAVVPAH